MCIIEKLDLTRFQFIKIGTLFAYILVKGTISPKNRKETFFKTSMDIKLLRIDDRLIHGQVAITWAKDTRISRIIVVSDEVAANPIQKALLSQAAPPDVKANVVTLKKLIEVYFHPLFMNVKVMLLFTNPSDVVTAYENGVYFNTVNIGGMKFTDGKQMVTHFISVDQTDIDAFKTLDKQDIELEIRKVPSDRKQLLMDVLKKGNYL